MTKVLILGGTGAMGSHLRGKLAAKGYEVVVSSRLERSSECGIRFVKGDAQSDSFLRDLLRTEKPDAVVDFMNYGTIRFLDRKKMLLDGTGHYLYLSSCRVFAGEKVHHENSPRLLDVSEDRAYLATDEYGLAKARQENILRDSGKTNWTIIRPCITYSSPRFQFGCLEAGTFVYRALYGSPSIIPEAMLDKYTTMMWGGDCAEMISRLILNSAALGEDFNTVTSESHTWREVGEIYRSLIGLKWQHCSLEDYIRVVGNPYQIKLGRLVHHRFDNAKVLRITGLRQEEFTTLQDGLAAEVSRLKEDLNGCPFDIRRNALMDSVTGTTPCAELGFKIRICQYESVRHPRLGKAIDVVRRMVRR